MGVESTDDLVHLIHGPEVRRHQRAKRFNEGILSRPLSPAQHNCHLGSLAWPLDGVRHVASHILVLFRVARANHLLNELPEQMGVSRPRDHREALPEVVLTLFRTARFEVDRAVLATSGLTQPPVGTSASSHTWDRPVLYCQAEISLVQKRDSFNPSGAITV